MASKSETTNGTAVDGTAINKARLSPGQRWIGIDNIILDERFQPRAKTDFDWVHDLSGFRKDGSEFPPVKVFQLADGRLIAASGFHRIPAMKMAGEEQIMCDVVDGTEEDAIVFAAGSNKGNGVKPMGPKDITKAVEMLLAVDAWWARSDMVVADHVGCSHGKAKAIRLRVAGQTGKPLPTTAIDKNGKTVLRSRTTAPGTPRKITRSKNRTGINGQYSFTYQATYRGKNIRGSTYEDVKGKQDKLIEADRAKKTLKGMKTALPATMGFDFVFSRSKGDVPAQFPGLFSYCRKGILCTPCDFSGLDSTTSAIGRLIAARRHLISQDPTSDLGPNVRMDDVSKYRMIVLCYVEDGPVKVIDLYRQEGFEFLSPDELVESLKSGEAQPEGSES